MLYRAKKKIVASIMIILIVFLSLILAAVYGSSYMSMKKQNSEMLERYISLYSLDEQPGDRQSDLSPPPQEDIPVNADGSLYKLASFYSIALSGEGEILASDTGRGDICQESEIYEAATEILAEKKTAGTLKHLMYRVRETDGYTLVAFMDITQTENSLSKLLLNILYAAVPSLLIIIFLAAAAAQLIVRPIEREDRKEKQFVSDAGHELKTPVSVISTNAEILSRQIGENEWLENIIYENERMGQLVQELLDLSRAENAAAEFEILDLSKLMEQEILPFECVAYERGLSIKCMIEPDIAVRGNRRQIGHLISILTDNAVSHSPGAGEITAELRREGKEAVVTVTNRGNIAAADLDHVFDRFYRTDEARSGEGHYGLGLSIAKAIAQSHKARIRAACENGQVTFTVSFPIEKR